MHTPHTYCLITAIQETGNRIVGQYILCNVTPWLD